MNDSAMQWLTDRASPLGTLACGLRRPDGNFVCHSVEETCPAATVEMILGHFDSIAGAVFTEFPAPSWSTAVRPAGTRPPLIAAREVLGRARDAAESQAGGRLLQPVSSQVEAEDDACNGKADAH